jgi:hypothetical protein
MPAMPAKADHCPGASRSWSPQRAQVEKVGASGARCRLRRWGSNAFLAECADGHNRETPTKLAVRFRRRSPPPHV